MPDHYGAVANRRYQVNVMSEASKVYAESVVEGGGGAESDRIDRVYGRNSRIAKDIFAEVHRMVVADAAERGEEKPEKPPGLPGKIWNRIVDAAAGIRQDQPGNPQPKRRQ